MGAHSAVGLGAVVNATIFTESRWQAVLGLPTAGLLWSFATFLAHSEQVEALGVAKSEALFYVALGGMAQTLLLWLGFTVVIWAMTRAFGGRVPLLRLMTLVSASSLALWVGAPAAAFWTNGAPGHTAIAATISLISMALFLHALTRGLSADLHWSFLRAAGAVSAASVFLASFAFLAL